MAILIGIDGYHESLGALACCRADVALLRRALVSRCGFYSDDVLVLSDDQSEDRQPTYGNIHAWLGTWLANVTPEDMVLLFFCGHGRLLDGTVLLAPADATLDAIGVIGISLEYVQDMLARCPAKHRVLIVDACHSGAGRDIGAMSSQFASALDASQSIYTIASCGEDEVSHEWRDKGHGVFTYYFAEALLNGVAPNDDGPLSLDAVFTYARDKCAEWGRARRVVQRPSRFCHTSDDIVMRPAGDPRTAVAQPDTRLSTAAAAGSRPSRESSTLSSRQVIDRVSTLSDQIADLERQVGMSECPDPPRDFRLAAAVALTVGGIPLTIAIVVAGFTGSFPGLTLLWFLVVSGVACGVAGWRYQLAQSHRALAERKQERHELLTRVLKEAESRGAADGPVRARGSRSRTMRGFLILALLLFGELSAIAGRAVYRGAPDDATGVIEQGKGAIAAVAVHPTAPVVVSGGKDGVVRLWNATTLALQAEVYRHSSAVTDVAFSADGRYLASSSYGSVAVCSSTGELLKEFPLGKRNAFAVALSPDGAVVACGGTGAVYILDVGNGALVRQLDTGIGNNWSVDISRSGEYLVACTASDEHARPSIWSMKSGLRVVEVIGAHATLDPAYCVKFDPTGRFIAFAGKMWGISICDALSGEELATLVGHSKAITDIAFAQDGRTLYSCSLDSTVRQWTLHPEAWKPKAAGNSKWYPKESDDPCTRVWRGHREGVWAVSVGREGLLVASAGTDGTIRLWR